MYTHNIIKKSVTYSGLLLATLFLSCSKDYLDVESFGTPEVENFYKKLISFIYKTFLNAKFYRKRKLSKDCL